MVIRQDFNSLPPRPYLEQIMDSVSKSYCFLWDRKDKKNRVKMTWKDISPYFHKHAFRSNIRKLNNEGLLSYEESDHSILIELVGWDDDDSK